MNYRLATILAREAHSVDTTKVIDIDVMDPISRLSIIYEPQNGAEGAVQQHPAKCITKIEIVDGSDVLYSLTGQEAQAADFYHNKKEPANYLYYLTGSQCCMVYHINFGRFLHDPLLSFNPRKFVNPQLKITIDINGGGMGCASGYLTVVADLFDGKVVEPVGFLMHKEIKDYALGSATHEYTDLPRDFPYRKLFVRGYKDAVGPDYIFGNFKLSEDVDRKIPFNHSMQDVLNQMVAQTPPYRERIITHGCAAGRYYWCTPGWKPCFAHAGWESSATIQGGNVGEGDGGRFKAYATTDGINQQWLVEGYCPHSTIEIPFGLQDDPEDWYDVTKIGNLKIDILSISGMSSSESAQIFLQQLRKYGAAA